MVALVFNAYGYVFQSGLDTLIRSYASAVAALEGDVERAKDDAYGYQQALEEGTEFIGERDEEGHILWSREDELNHTHQMAEDALRTLRRAFAISAYHQWERAARTWTKAHRKLDHDKVVKLVEALGQSVDPRLEAVRRIANLLKHDNDYWGEKVLELAPDVIDPVQVTRRVPTEWYEAVILTEQHMTDIFNIVSASGPSIDTKFN